MTASLLLFVAGVYYNQLKLIEMCIHIIYYININENVKIPLDRKRT